MRIAKTRPYARAYNAVRYLVPKSPRPRQIHDDTSILDEALPLVLDWPDGCPRPVVAIMRDTGMIPTWTRYAHFLRANAIGHTLCNLHRSDWQEQLSGADLVLWRPASAPAAVDECRRKVYAIERHLDMLAFPSIDEIALYEDKALQWELMSHHGLPAADTFLTYSREEAEEALGRLAYPLIAKIVTGASSLGVELVRSEGQGRRLIRQAFSYCGRPAYWPDVRQKGYVLLQRYVPNPGFDLRVTIAGDVAHAFYRGVPKGEFRASGMSVLVRDDPPVQAVRLAQTVAERLGFPALAVDMVYDLETDQFVVIEITTFPGAHAPNGIRANLPDVLFQDAGASGLKVIPGPYWMEELALRAVLIERWLRPRGFEIAWPAEAPPRS